MGTVITACNRCGSTVIYNTNRFVVTEYDGRDGVGFRESEEFGLVCPECGDGKVPDGIELYNRMLSNLPYLDDWAEHYDSENREFWENLFDDAGYSLPFEYKITPLPSHELFSL